MDGNYEVVKLLLDHHADPNMGDGWDYNPLATASANNHIEVMRLLIARGARVNDDQFGSSALWQAAMDGKTESGSFLLAHGANPNTTANGNEKLLHALESVEPRSNIIALLKKAGAKE